MIKKDNCFKLLKSMIQTIIHLLKYFFAILIIIINSNINNSPPKEHPFYLRIRKPIILKDKNKKKILLRGRKFLNRCLKGLYNKKYLTKVKPKVSSIIPVYNCEKTINAALLSIQEQNLTKLEIILVNDFSNDNIILLK